MIYQYQILISLHIRLEIKSDARAGSGSLAVAGSIKSGL